MTSKTSVGTMKKPFVYISSTLPILTRRNSFPDIVKRHVHIKSSYEITDKHDTVSSQILHTDNNQLENEPDTNYVDRSFLELGRRLHKDMTGKDLVIFKINQCVIDPKKWKNEHIAEPIYNGHVIAGLFKIDHFESKPILFPNSTISKTRKGIEKEQAIYEQRFFYNKKLAALANLKKSKEYFWVITLDKLNLSHQVFLDRCKNIRDSPGAFNLLKSACGQSIYRLITGKPAAEEQSPQTATVLAVLDVLDNNDDKFNSNLRNRLIESELSKFADELGREYTSMSSNEDAPSLLPNSHT